MPTIQNSTRGQVVQIWGKAYIRGTDGVWRPLAVGEVVPQGAELLTEQNAIVMMTRGETPLPKVTESTVERAISAVEKGDEPPAAGLQGGGNGDLQPGLRVDRIVESVTPASIDTRLDTAQVEFGRATQSDPGASPLVAPQLVAASSSIAAVEAGGSVNLGLRAPSGPGTLTITVTTLPTIGQVFTAAGTPVTAGTVLSADELAGLTYTPPADYTAGTPVGAFGYSVTNGTDTVDGGTRIAVTPVNDAPLAIDASNSGGEDILLDVSLAGTDIDGTVASVAVRTLPANGTLLLRDTLAPVAVGAALTPAQAASLVFRPNANWNGSTTLTFTVTDNEGLTSAPATVQLQITPVNDPPLAADDTSSTVARAPVTVAVLGNDTDADNDPLTVTSANVAAALGNVVVNGDGTLTFTAAAGITGPVVISYTISDPSGATSTATLTVNVAAAPTVTVDAPALTNDPTPTLTGTSNLAPGSTVTLTVTDALGAVQTFSTTVRADGTYSVDVPAPLAEGPYTAVANVNGPGGTTATANDNGEVDVTPPVISVDAPALTNDTTPALTGTTDLPAGSTITLTVTGANGVSQLFTTTVQAGGVFSVDVPAALVSGPFTVSARGTDAAGNSATATDNGVVDNVPPVITVDAPASTNDTTPPLTGTTDLPVGATVTLTVTGANGAVQTFTTTVQTGGVFSVSVPAALVEGGFTVVASGTDAAGNTATASDNGVIDITAPAVTVDAPAMTNDTTPPLTGTTNLPAGSTVSLVVTGANGASQTFAAVVQTGGTFSVDVPAALVQGIFNVTATATDAAGNSATATDTGEIDTTPPAATMTIDPVTADNIVNAGEASGNITLTGTVGGDVRVGDTVTLNVNGVNYTGVVLAGNTFAIAVPGAGVLADADRRIDGSVTTTDNAGNSATATAQRPYSVNSAPIAVNDTLSIGEDTPVAGSDVTPGTAAQDRDADGDTLTVVGVVTGVQPSASGNVNTPLAGAWGTLLLDGLGAYTYAPSAAAQALDPGQTVTDTFTYTISDGRGGSATATLAISVVGANDPTTISGVFIGAVTEDAVATASGTLSNNDPDVGTRAFVAQTNSAGAYGTFSIDSAGTWTYTLTNAAANVQALAQGQNVTETFIVATDDGTTASITVTVNGANDAPVVSSTSINAVEEGSAVGLGLAAPTDIDNASVLTITVTGLPTIGQVQLADGTPVANGTTLTATQLAGLRYLPPADYSGAPVGAFAYSVSDGITATNGGTTINVSAVNDRPVAIDSSASGFEDTTTRIAVTPAGSDVDGTISSYTLTSVPANGSLYAAATGSAPLAAGAVVTGPVYFQPNPNFNGTVSFNYTATDNSGGVSANTATATIVVNPVNDAPTLTGVVATFNYSEGSTPTVVRTVIDGSVVLADIDSPNFGGGSVTVAIANVVAAEDLLGVRNQGAADGQISVSGTTVSYNPIGAAGLVAIGTIAGGSGSAPLVITLNSNASVAAVDALLQNITYGNASQLPTTTQRNLTITVVDGDGTANGGADTVSVNVNVNITRVNDAPLFTALNGGVVNTTEGAAPALLDTNATVNDPELGSGFVGAINNMGGAVLTLARVGGANAQDQFSASGGTLSLAAGNVVLGGNTVGTYNTAALANGSLQITFAAGTTQADATSVLRQIRYVNTSDAPAASVAIGYTINDGNTGSQGTGGARSGTATVTVNIAAVNDAPLAANDNEATTENAVLNASVPAATDADGTIASYALVAGPGAGNGTLTFNTDGTYSFNPGANFNNLPAGATRDVTFTYTATDNSGAVSNVATVTITVTGENDPPVANPDSASTLINTLISNINVLGNDTDPDTGAVLSVTGATVDPLRGAVTVNPDGTVNFTPAANITGPVTITYTLSDGTATTTGTLTVNVGSNTPPTGADNAFTIDEDATRTFGAADFGFADADLGQTLQAVRIDTLPAAGTLTLSGVAVSAGQVIAAAQLGNLVFTPVANANGAPYASFTFSVQDSAGSFDAAPNTVTLNVTPQPDTAVIGGDAAGAVVEDGTLADSGALTVTDPDAGQAAFNPQTGSAGSYGSFSIDSAGTWTYNLANASPLVQALAVGQQVSDTFAVTTIDGTSRNVVVTITGTNDVPVVSNASAATTENTTLDSNVPAGSDIDGTVASYALGSGVGAGNGALTFNADGSYRFNPDGNFDTLAAGQSRDVTFTYTATDNNGGVSLPATVTITVTGANDAPNGADAAYTIAEDGSRAFAGADFGFSDVDAGDTLAAVRIDSLPAAGTLTLNGTAVSASQLIDAADLPNLVFTPLANATGAPYASFTFSVQDSGGLFDAAPNTITLSVTPVNDPPVAVVTPASGDEDTPVSVSLTGADIDGTIASVRVTVLPGNGVLYLADGITPVVANTPLTPAQAASLLFVPAADFNGTVNVTFTVTDNSGAVSSPAITPITVAPVVDPVISIDDVSVNEADSTMTFTVSLSGPTTAAVSVNYATSNGTATAADYTATSGTLNFAAGVTSQTVTVNIAEDLIAEGNESLNVTLSAPVNATIGDNLGVGTIIDNDGAPTLTVSSPTIGEAGGFAVFTLNLSNPSATATTFSLALADGTAGSADYGPALEVSTDGGTTWANATSATFAAGATSVLVRTPVANDALDETDETFTLTATRTAGTTSNTSAVGTATISDDDATPSLSIDDVTVNEAAGTATFTVTLSAASGQTVTVGYNSSNGTATAGADYTALIPGTLTFTPGVTSQTITVDITNDTVFESAQDFNVNLTAPTNATVADGAGLGTITDNDAAPTISSVSAASAVEATSLVHTVTLSNASSSTSTFSLSLTDGTASGGGVDYTSTLTNAAFSNGVTISGSTITVPAGVTSFTVSVPSSADTIDEADETYTLNVGAASGAGTINDDDNAPTISSVSSPIVTEGSDLAYAVTLSNASATATTFAYTLGGGNAAATDYGTATFSNGVTLSGGILTVPAGVTAFSITLPTTPDTLDEIDETVPVTVGGFTGTGTITDNDATPSLSIDDVTVNEAAGTATFTVTLSAASGQTVSVNYASGNVTASAGADYTANSGTLTFAPGVTSQTVTIDIAEDTIFEGSETFNVALTAATNATIADSLGVGAITDNDTAPTLSVSSPTVGEADGYAQFTLSLGNPSATATTVSLALANGTATAADYGSALEISSDGGATWVSATSATFAAGATSVLVRTPVSDDALDEIDESFTLTATRTAGSTSNASATGTATITDDDATPSLSIDDVTVNEAAGTMTFTVTLSAASGQNVSVNYATGDVTATTGADYTAGSGTLTFAAGVISQTVTVTIAEDTVFEGSEALNVTLSGATNATIADNLGIGTITDNDAAPTVSSVSSPNVAEGTNLVYTVNLSNASSTATTFAYTLGGGSAAAADYGTPTFSNGVTLSAGILTVPAGVTAFLITLPTTPDTLDEIDETVPVTVGGVSGTGTITDDDATPSLSIDDVTVNEAAGTMTFTVTLSAASGQNVSVNYATSNGTATAGADYTAGSGTLSFAPGVVSQTVTVNIAEDTIFEGSEDFNVTLTTPVNATIADTLGVGTIADNDTAPTLAVSSPSVGEADGYAQFTLSLSNPAATATTVSLALADGTATAADFGPALEVSTDGGATWTSATSATFAAGATSVLVRTPVSDDALDEIDESFTLTATRTAGSTSNASATGTAVITDNDATPSLSIGDVTVNEAAGTMTFTVTLSAASGQAVSVGYATGNGSAIAGADYTATSGTLNFAAGVTSQTITVNIAEDLIAEGNESFNVTLSAPVNATIGDNLGVGTIIDNDGAPTLSVSSPTVGEAAGFAVFTLALSNPSAAATTVSLALADGTAGSADYGPALEVSTDGGTTWISATSATFAAGATSVLVRTPVANDTLDEADEGFTLTATRTAGTTANTSAVGTATITDNDATPSLSIDDVTVNEAAGTATFTVTLSAASGQTVTVGYNSSNGSATAGSDYTALVPGTLTFAPGVTSQTITVNITNDTVFESSEDFNVNLTAPTNATIADGAGLGTITDNDAAPTISSVSLASAVEATSLVHTVTLSNASSSTSTFSLSLVDVTATGGGVDYTSTLTNAAFSNGVTISGGVITVPAGVTSFTVAVPTSADTIDEADETYTLNVGAASGAGTINDDDNAPTISSVSDATRVEGLALVHTVTLSNASSSVTTFAYTLGGGSATGGGTDYTTPPTFSNGVTLSGGILSVPAGVTSFTVSVPSTLDTIDEGASESYNLSVGGFAALGTINDDDDAPTISSVSSPSVSEGSDLVYAVTLSNASATATTFAYTLGGGSAAITDYGTATFSNGVTLSGGILTVPAGVTAFSITLPTTPDTLDEIDETVPVTVGGFTGTGTITDNDATPSLSIDDVTVNEAAGTATFTVTLSAASGQTVSVDFATSDATATAGADYTALASTTLTFAPGTTTQTVTVSILDDGTYEGAETFNVLLSGAVNATIADGTGLGTIRDDGNGTGGNNDDRPALSVADTSATEGGYAVFTVSLSNASTTAVTFNPALASGTATVGADTATALEYFNGTSWVAVTAAGVTIAAGSTSAQVRVAITDDVAAEGNESFTLTAIRTAGTTTNASASGTATIADEAAPDVTTVNLSATGTVAEGGSILYTATLSNAAVTATTVTITGGITIAIAAGQTVGTVSVLAPTDDVYLDAGNVTRSITTTSGGGGFESLVVGTASASTTVTDTIDNTTLSISGPGSITEGAIGTYTVSLTSPVQTTAVTVNLAYSGTAANGVDYSGVATVTIPVGASSATFDVSAIDDAFAESSETVIISVASAAGGNFESLVISGTNNSVTTTLADEATADSVLVSLAGPAAVTEGVATGNYTVTLGQAAVTAVTVNLTYNGTAANGADYTGVVSVIVPAGSTSANFNLATIDDSLADSGETIIVTLGTITGGGFEAIGAHPTNNTVTTTISDEATADTVLVSLAGPAAVTEGVATGNYTVTLGQTAVTAVTVNLTYTGTAANGADYTGVVSVIVPAGSTSANFNLATIDDALADSGETIIVTLGSISGGGFEVIAAHPTNNTITTTIADEATADVVLVSLTGPAAVTEGATTGNYTVTLGQTAVTAVTVNLTYTGTAANGADYTGVVSVIVPAGSTSANFNLATIDDSLADSGETIIVTLGTITGGGFEAIAAHPTNNTVTTTIGDEATADTVLVSLAGPAAVTEGAATGNYTVTLAQTAVTPVTVNLTYTGTASNGTDYTGVVSVTIPAGSTSAIFNLATIDDALADSGETIIVTLGSITGGGFEAIAAHPTNNSVTTTIADEATADVVLVSLAGPAAVIEGVATGNYTVTLGQAAATAVTVNLTYTGTAANGADYTGVVSVIVPAGSTSAVFNLATIDDALADSGETIIVTLGSITGGGFEAIAAHPTNNTVTTTISDEATADVVLVSLAGPAAVTEGVATGNYTVTLGQAAATAVTVNLTYTGTAANGADYTGVVSVTVPAGSTSAVFNLATIDDALADSGETIIVTLGTITGGGFEAIAAHPTNNTVTTTISDEATADVVLVSLAGPAAVTEGVATGNYTVTLAQTAVTAVTVNLTYTGTASNGADYTGVVSVTVPAGSTSAIFDLTTIDDIRADSGETIIVTLGSISGGGFEAIAAHPTNNSVTTTISDEATPDVTTVNLSATGTVAEGGSILYTATLTNAAITATTVTITGGVTISIAAGQTVGTVSVLAPTEDAYIDGGIVTRGITATSGGGFESLVVGTGSASTTVTDTINTTTLSISGPGSITEGAIGAYTVSLNNPAQTAVTVNLTYSGTAANGADYTGVATVTILAGSSSANFDISTIDDLIDEVAAESFTVAISTATGGNFEALAISGTNNSVTTSIADNDNAPTVSIANIAVAESGYAQFTLSLSNPSSTATSFNLALANGATNPATGGGVDYGAGLEVSTDGGTTWTAATAVTIAAGATSVLVRTPVTSDVLDEANETFTLTATRSAGTTFNNTATGTATITDDDNPPSFSINDVTVNEATGSATFTISLSAASGQATSVNYATSNVTATAGSDYTAVASTTLNFAAGVTSQTITVAITNDAPYEGAEIFNVLLSGAVNAAIADNTGVGTIFDDGTGSGGTNDDRPSIAVSSPTVDENVVGGFAQFTLTLSSAAGIATVVNLALANGSASGAGVDFGAGLEVSTNGGTTWTSASSVTIPAGATTALVRTPIVNDLLDEANEIFTLTATPVSGTSNTSATGTATITDNDPTPSLTINDVTVNEAAGTMGFTVTLSAASGLPVSVNYATGGGTATAGSDYTANSGTLTFAPGVTSMTIDVAIADDTVFEPGETLYVNLSAPSNATIADSLGIGTIIDNDATPTVSSVSPAAINEGGNLEHTVILSNASSTPTTLAYTLTGVSATAGVDYNATPTFSNGVTLAGGVLTVPAGVTSFTVTVASIADVIDEANETYNLAVGGVTAVGTINDDDNAPSLNVSNITVNETAGFAVFSVSLGNPSSSAVSVNLAFANGTATGGTGTSGTTNTDYGTNSRMQVSNDGGATWSALGTNTATFAAGQTSVLVRTYVNNNTPTSPVDALRETFTLTATNAAATTSNPTATGTATIVEQDISITSATVTEGTGAGTTTGTLTVTINPAFGTATSLPLTLSGTALSPADYGNLTFSNGVTASGGNINIPSGVTSFTITVPVVRDALDETNETVVVNIAGSNGTLTITDDDAAPTLAINDVTVNEGAGTATFTVTLSAASGQTVTVNYGMINQTALSGVDYTASAGTLTFAPGTTTQTITVPILQDNVYEGSEAFRINLSAPVNATIADGVGIGTIADNGTGAGGTDNDTPTLAVSSITASDQGNGFATFVVSLSNPSTTATSVSLALANGTATGGGVDYGASGATNLQVSTDNGVTWSNATTATIAANNSYVLVRTPIIGDVANEVSETFTLTATRTAGTTTNTSASGIGTITDIYNGPDAISDAPSAMLQEDTPAQTVLAGNVIQGGSGNVADTDPNNDTLLVTGAAAGNSLVTGLVALASPVTVSGTFGNLLIQADGTYTYTLDNARIQTQNMLGGQVYNDVFSYRVTDGNGGYDTATITVNVTGTLDLTAITPQPVAIAADGLQGEYYGYNDTTVAGNRVHADDGTATSLGTGSNLESVEDITAIINGRNAAMGGPNNIVGTNLAGAANAADVIFNVRTLNYGTTPVVSSDLGDNAAVAAGNALPPQDNISGSGTTTALANFLDQDSSTARVQTGTPTGATVGTQTGMGQTTDALIRMTGFVYLERGNYDFRVTGDDGYRLRVGGETLIEFDGNQPPTTRTYSNVEVNDRISGLTSIELLYWEQGGNANLQFEFKLSDSNTWVPFSLDSIAFFSAATAPTLTDTRIQDIVETNVNQQYNLRTGSVLDGDNNTNTLTGAEGRDYIQGLGGDDILNGNGSADYLDGGIGNDALNGGDGNDILVGGTGNDTMIGGLGDDIYRVDSAGDVVTELAGAGQGTDTVEFEASYNVGTYVVGNNVENALLLGSFNSNVTGNAVNNRITGNDGNNILIGGAGDDRLLGGRGNDTLSGDAGALAGGGAGKDIFEWNLADRATAGAPAIDRITDFTYSGSTTSSAVPSGDLTPQHTDVLDLRDLLSGESSTSLNTGAIPNIGNLQNYIDISVVGGETSIRISSTGGFAGGTYAAGQEDQRIVLTGVDLYSVTGTTTEAELLQRLLANGTLVVD